MNNLLWSKRTGIAMMLIIMFEIMLAASIANVAWGEDTEVLLGLQRVFPDIRTHSEAFPKEPDCYWEIEEIKFALTITNQSAKDISSLLKDGYSDWEPFSMEIFTENRLRNVIKYGSVWLKRKVCE